MTDTEFEKLVAEGMNALPLRARELMQNVSVVIADEITPEEREAGGYGEYEVVFGLYEGVPQTERGEDYSLVLPDKITIFKNPILATYEQPEDIRACVRNTVWHEFAHHFGYDDPWIHAEEEKRGKTL